ncbi:MAG: hypothetical protein JWO12_87 [Frankiales bacterium]|nr:hypothetical protein [Frankiales bacterium]
MIVSATVRTWEGGAGTALLDDGSVIELPPDCLRGSVFRFLRPGQRVHLTVADGMVTEVGL